MHCWVSRSKCSGVPLKWAVFGFWWCLLHVSVLVGCLSESKLSGVPLILPKFLVRSSGHMVKLGMCSDWVPEAGVGSLEFPWHIVLPWPVRFQSIRLFILFVCLFYDFNPFRTLPQRGARCLFRSLVLLTSFPKLLLLSIPFRVP